MTGRDGVHMFVIRHRISLLAALILGGCSAGQSPEPPAPPSQTVFDTMTQTMDRARAVQGTVDAQANATRQAVEAAEGQGSAQDAPH